MTWDEMKNKISMGLKDPTLQQGFECICNENTELKCECRRCVYTDCPCVLSDYGKDKNGICDHFKDVFDENAELKADNDARKFAMTMSEKVEKQLREENAKQTIQLTKAKELLKKIYNFEYGVEADFPKFDLVKWSIETRDFLKDSEVEK